MNGEKIAVEADAEKAALERALKTLDELRTQISDRLVNTYDFSIFQPKIELDISLWNFQILTYYLFKYAKDWEDYYIATMAHEIIASVLMDEQITRLMNPNFVQTLTLASRQLEPFTSGFVLGQQLTRSEHS